MTTIWQPKGLTAAPVAGIGHPPVITAADAAKILPGFDLWDCWPARHADGAVAQLCGGTLWAALSAPVSADPSQRHDVAAIRALQHCADGSWHDLGPMFEPGNAAGTRQWAGATTVAGDRLVTHYTAAGTEGEAERSFRQRIFTATTSVECRSGLPVFGAWSEHTELFAPDERYDPATEVEGRPGFIKAFRDPFPFVDPSSGISYILFTGSVAPDRSMTDFNGAIGIARREAGAWVPLDPLVTADGVNNELERPHVVVHDDRYYLFFSTQARTFHPDVTGPTGLFGFGGDSLLGPYRPLNGHGLVFTNPPTEPLQAYSWLVLDDLTTASFVDAYGLHGTRYLDGALDDVGTDPTHFGGTLAPAVRLGLDGDRAWIDQVDVAPPPGRP